MKRGLRFAVLCLALLAPARARPADPPAATKKELVVFAAASLRELFEGLSASFERAHPGTKVRLNLAGSQELRTQIEQGAKADVFASADLKHMAALEKAGLVDAPAVFARNEAVIVVPRGNPAAIRGLADLPKIRRLVVGAPEVPIGGYTVKILDAAARTLGADFRKKVEASIVSRELNVKQVLAKVTLGEADAGIVYRTDVSPAPAGVVVVSIPDGVNAIASYPIATVTGAPHAELGRAFVDLVLSAEGQRALGARGFAPADPRP